MFRIKVDTKRVENWIPKIPKNIRKRANVGLKEFGEHAVKEILMQAKLKGIRQFRSSRSMFTSTRYVQQSEYGYIKMPMSGVYQDRARPHWVTINKSKPMLYAWARQKGFTGSGFYFRNKPFVSQGLRNAKKRLMPIMRPQITLAIRESH